MCAHRLLVIMNTHYAARTLYLYLYLCTPSAGDNEYSLTTLNSTCLRKVCKGYAIAICPSISRRTCVCVHRLLVIMNIHYAVFCICICFCVCVCICIFLDPTWSLSYSESCSHHLFKNISHHRCLFFSLYLSLSLSLSLYMSLSLSLYMSLYLPLYLNFRPNLDSWHHQLS